MADDDPSSSSSTATAAAAKGIVLLLLSLICLGTWPALLRLCTFRHGHGSDGVHFNVAAGAADGRVASSRAVRIIRRWAVRRAQNRHPCHAYIDYALAYVFFSSTVPLALDYFSGGAGRNDDASDAATVSTSFLSQLPLLLAACAGGSLLSLGNISTQWSITVYRAPLTTVLSLQASLCVVLGTSVNYRLQPDRTAHFPRLVGGVGMFLVAIALSVMAHGLYAQDVVERNKGHTSRSKSVLAAVDTNSATDAADCSAGEEEDVGISLRDVRSHGGANASSSVAGPPSGLHDYHACIAGASRLDDEHDYSDVNRQRIPGGLARPSSETMRDGFVNNEYTSNGATTTRTTTTGLGVAFMGGLCFGFFSPAFNMAVNDPLMWNDGRGLSVATANFWFSVAFTVTSVLWNVRLMRHPPVSAAEVVEPSSLRLYLIDASWRDRTLALSAGLVCAAGNVLQFQGGNLAGFAASDLVQAFPLVGTAWDVAAFGEFQGARRAIGACIGGMYVVYLGGICLLASSIAV